MTMTKKLVCNLRNFMEQQNINNYQLSRKLEVADNTIRGYVKNNFSRIDGDVAIKICDYFKVSLGEMFQIVDE
jgi:plasmid maintenance system antidote protein VapI